MTSSYRSGKVSHLTLLVLSCITIGIGLLVGKNIYALDLDLIFSSFQPTLAPKTFPVDFKRGRNQYIGGIIIEGTEALQQIQQIYFPGNDTTIRCGRKVKGYYFNSARGLRLWPLDDNSLDILKRDSSYNSLTLNPGGGLYTSCIGHPQDVVGYIKYTEAGVDQGALFFGVQTNSSNNTATNSYNASGFVLQDGKYPQGKFYDSIVGIGEVSSLIDQVNEGIANTARNISVQGRLGISSVVDSLERNTIKTNIGKKSLIYSSDEVTSSKIINLALKNAAIACRGGNTFETLDEALDSSSKVICIDNDSNEDIIINDGLASQFANKDIVIKNRNVIIDKSVYINNKSLSLFIDKGNLIIDTESISSSDLKSFDNNGYRSSSTSTTVTQGILLQGNYIINGLIYGGTNNNTDGDIIPVKTFIHGKFASLNLPTASYPQREKQVKNVLGNDSYKQRISLANVFTWRCDPITGSGVDISGTISNKITCNNSTDNHRDSALIVIEKDYPSTLLLNK